MKAVIVIQLPPKSWSKFVSKLTKNNGKNGFIWVWPLGIKMENCAMTDFCQIGYEDKVLHCLGREHS